MAIVRSTIAFAEKNWQKLATQKNRSKLVNTALDYYFRAQGFLQEKEEEFFLQEMKHFKDSGESYTFEETFR